MRVLVCGGRDFGEPSSNPTEEQIKLAEKQRRFLKDWLYNYFGGLGDWPKTGPYLIAGKAKGADTVAIDWAVDNWLSFKEYPADWNTYGKAAGYIRNKQMLDEGKPDLVIAFPGGKGTRMMVSLAKEAGVEVIEVRYEEV